MDTKEKLVEQLREMANRTPPICHYDKPCNTEIFGKQITVYCKPFEQFQELLREVADYISHGAMVQENCKACAEATQKCIVKLQEQIAELRSAQEWISVEDRLPQDDLPFGALCEIVQVLLDDGTVTVGWCNRGLKCWYYMPVQATNFVGHDYDKTPVVAWQPLAQPPKGE